MKKFPYQKSRSIIYWGCAFDSVLEMKYAVSVHRDYEFLRGHVTILYRHGCLKPVDYIAEGVRHYTPDFLIRHKQTGEAFLVEIKPRAFQGHPQLDLRARIAHNYIHCKGYDWKFKVVFDDEIELSPEDEQLFRECCVFKVKSMRTREQAERYNKLGISTPFFMKAVPTNRQVEYVMFGSRADKSFWGNKQ